jgi:tryptophan-rich sensory protein
MIKPILIFTIAMSLFLGLFLNHFARVNKVWEAFPKPDLFYYFYWEDLVWMFLWVLFSITLYASFFVRHFPKTVTKRMKLFFAVFSGITLIYMLLVFAFPVLRGKYTDYAYLEMGISALPSIIIVLYGERKKLPKLLKFGVISFFLSLFIEIVGKRHELWGFKGEYAGWVNIFGAAFPIEEFVIWMVLGGISLAAYYEIFLGNKE